MKIKVTLEDKNGKPYDRFVTKGCGVACENEQGIHDVICPSCINFIWHGACLEMTIAKKKMMYDTPITYSYGDDWCCPQCFKL